MHAHIDSCAENKKRNKEQVIPRGGSAALVFRELDASHNRTGALEIINTDNVNDKILPCEIQHRRDPIRLI